LIYGFYPDVLNNAGDEVSILQNLVNSYLYRDILALQISGGLKFLISWFRLLPFSLAMK
jgi:hypothetical protein